MPTRTRCSVRAGRGRRRSRTTIRSFDNTDSRTVATLTAGTHTIEATTYSATAAGEFTLTVAQ